MSQLFVSVKSKKDLFAMHDFLKKNLRPWWQVLLSDIDIDHPLVAYQEYEYGETRNILPNIDEDLTLAIAAHPNGTDGLVYPTLSALIPSSLHKGSGYFTQCIMRFVATKVGIKGKVFVPMLDDYMEVPSVKNDGDLGVGDIPIIYPSPLAAAAFRKMAQGDTYRGTNWRSVNQVTFGTGYTAFPSDFKSATHSKAYQAGKGQVFVFVKSCAAADLAAQREMRRLSDLWCDQGWDARRKV
jgi:hypothetical protein